MERENYKTLNEQETRDLLTSEEQSQAFANSGMEKWELASEWLADLLDERSKTDGFQYNSKFQQWIEKAEGWEEADENGSVLSLLIYNSQSFRRVRAKRQAGYEMLTEAMIHQAIKEKRKIEIYSESIIGDSTKKGTPKILNDGRSVVMYPRSRTKGWTPGSAEWAKIDRPEPVTQTSLAL